MMDEFDNEQDEAYSKAVESLIEALEWFEESGASEQDVRRELDALVKGRFA